MSISRRKFIKNSLLGLTTLATSNIRAWELPSEQTGRLIVILLRGGLDGLFAFSPVADPLFSKLRPNLSRTVLSEGIQLGKTGFAAHPSCAQLAVMFDTGELAFAPCAGTTDNSRSHFQAQDVFELGTGLAKGNSGFMSRTASELGDQGAISFTSEIPLAFQGDSVPEVAQLGSGRIHLPRGHLLEAMRKSHAGAPTGAALEQAIITEMAVSNALDEGAMEPTADRHAAPATGFVRVAVEMGQILRRNPAMNLVFVDIGGFDTHANQASILPGALTALSEGITSLRNTLGTSEWKRTQIIVCSEFGRTASENGTAGTDHGHGGTLLLVGGSIQGGRMLGTFQGLNNDCLHEGRDLPVLLDWRTVLTKSMQACFGLNQAAMQRIFPAV